MKYNIEKIIIGSRESKLARAHIEIFKKEFSEKVIESQKLTVESKFIKTSGDKFLDKNISEIGNKGLFTKEIDQEQINNHIHIGIVEKKSELLKKMGNKKLTVELQQEINEIPSSLEKYNLLIGSNKMSLDYTYDLKEKQTGITNLLQDIKDSGLKLRDLKTEQSNLEKIFVTLVRENNEN